MFSVRCVWKESVKQRNRSMLFIYMLSMPERLMYTCNALEILYIHAYEYEQIKVEFDTKDNGSLTC